MARICDSCGKTVVFGQSLARRGLAKYKGGVGIKTTGVTKRKFKPNTQRIRVSTNNGTVCRMRICTKCVRAGKVKKPVRRDIPEGLRQRMLASEKHWSPEARKQRAAVRAERRRERKAAAKASAKKG